MPVQPIQRQLQQLPSGLRLELSLNVPTSSASSEETGVAILLHPWSWLGGCMNDPVLHILSARIVDLGFHAIVYNSRGVGRSSGWCSFTGRQEVADLQELTEWALDYVPNVKQVLLMGYSHGSLIASQLKPLPTSIKTRHVLLSYPLGPRSILTCFQSNYYEQGLLSLAEHTSSSVLLVYGDTDEFTGKERYATWSESLIDAGGGESGRVSAVCINEGSHFWRGNDGDSMLETITDWLRQ